MLVGSTSPAGKVRVSVLADPLAGRQGGRPPHLGTCICQIQLSGESSFPSR